MEGLLERQRHLHEEKDRLEQAITDELLERPRSHRSRLLQEHLIRALLARIASTSRQLKMLYTDEDNSRKRELDALAATNEFGSFYSRLKTIKDYHRRYPGERADATEFAELRERLRLADDAFENMFSGEEGLGRYLDLHLAFECYINLKGVERIEYLKYLSDFDNFMLIPRSTKSSAAYTEYLDGLIDYFEGYFRRSRPLFELDGTTRKSEVDFEAHYRTGNVDGWDFAAIGGQVDAEELDQMFCTACKKQFTNKSVYEAHLPGKKHSKAAAESNGAMSKGEIEEIRHKSLLETKNKYKTIASKEFRIGRFAELLGQVREETRSAIERKQSRTFEEREEDVEVLEEFGEEPLPGESTPVAAGEDDGKIYNPLKLPLDWDGKPIPYWLWKLHGLGVEFPCEICGNYIYMGRKAFDQHFFEWRHAHGMKCLGIPNTKHFFQITAIEDAQALWDKLKQQARAESFRSEVMEEFEDHQGNVYNRKTYEDLRRQGLL